MFIYMMPLYYFGNSTTKWWKHFQTFFSNFSSVGVSFEKQLFFFFCSHSFSNCYLYFEGTTCFLFICFCFCFQKQLGDSVLISSKKRAANVSYLSFCKRKNMPLISVWQFENCPQWMLEWVRGRSPEQILNFPVWTFAWMWCHQMR